MPVISQPISGGTGVILAVTTIVTIVVDYMLGSNSNFVCEEHEHDNDQSEPEAARDVASRGNESGTKGG